jgi:1-acyl-sn-glycerol-3-phosphate acyltransferase
MMSIFFPAPLVGLVAALVLIASTVVFGTLISVLGLLKLIPVSQIRRVSTEICLGLAANWVSTNRLFLRLLHPVSWDIDYRAKLDPGKSYLIIGNHQSWADILIMFDLFHMRLPFPRFFLKHELLYVPLVGTGCRAMDFPFMKRHGKEAIAKNPALHDEDLETTRRACAIYRASPTALVSYLEGTRFSEAKRVSKNSPYRHLLRPKSAGLSFTLNTMGEQFGGIIDVTLAYEPTDKPLLWSWLCGEQDHLQLHVDLLPIPAEMLRGDYENDPEFRARFQNWVNGIWTRKDARLDSMQSRPAMSAQRPAHY